MKHIFKHVFASRSDYGDNLRAAAVVSAVLNCSTRLREVSAGCKRRAATRNSPKLKPERIRACCGESEPPNSEDLLDVVGIAESLVGARATALEANAALRSIVVANASGEVSEWNSC
jgi:hypothetical protein